MRNLLLVLALAVAAIVAKVAPAQFPPPFQPSGLAAICQQNGSVDDAFDEGDRFCTLSLADQRLRVNQLSFANRVLFGKDKVYFDPVNHPDVVYEVGPNPANWKTSVDSLDVGYAVTYMKRTDNRENDPVLGVERARLTMVVFKTSSPVLDAVRGIGNKVGNRWRGEVPVQYTWDRPSGYREGASYGVAVKYATASPANALSANPIKDTAIDFDFTGAWEGKHYFNAYSLQQAVDVLTAFRKALIDGSEMVHCDSEDQWGDPEPTNGMRLHRDAGNWEVSMHESCIRTSLAEPVPARTVNEIHLIETAWRLADTGDSPVSVVAVATLRDQQ